MDKPKFVSEELEPVFALVTGRLWARVEWEREHGDEWSLASELENFWWGVCALEKLVIACDGATHCSLATSNNVRRAQALIESITGRRPEYSTGIYFFS